MNTHYLPGFLYFTPYLLIFFLGMSIEIVLFRRIRRKKADDNSLKENGVQISGSLMTCHKRTRMADITYTYEVQGKIYSQVQHVPEETCNIVHHGDAVVVFYDVQKPERSLLKDIEREYLEVFPATVLFLLVLMYGLTLAIIFIIILIMSFIRF
jgi:Protein of unknown function (DUF3592)